MKNFFLLILFLAIITTNIMAQQFTPPVAEKSAVRDSLHGFIITDYYRWLEDKEDPKVKDWSHAQHDYTVKWIEKYPQIDGLETELRNYLDRDLRSAPFYKADREFFYLRKKGDKQSKLYTVLDGKEVLIFDPEKIDPSGNSAMTGTDMTDDASKAAIGLQFKGNEISDYRIIDTKTGEILYDDLKNVYYFSWCNDENYAYITIRDKEKIEKQQPLPSYRHKIGTAHTEDKYLFSPEDAKNFAYIWDTEEGELTFISRGDFYSNSLEMKKVNSDAPFKKIYESSEFKANPNVKNGKIYFMTNHKAPNFKIMVANIEKPEFENWSEFYAEKETVLESYVITDNYVIIQDKKDVLSRLSVYDLTGKFIKVLDLPVVGNVGSMGFHKETNKVYVTFNAFEASSIVYRLDGKTLEWKFIYQDKPPVDTKNITSELVFFESKDGTKIPMFLVHRKNLKKNGSNPTLLYGYGGFNISMEPSFVGTTASFINRGGVYAIACLRGGAEYGESWHRDGMLFKKQNTFDDFIYAAEYLIKENYTSAERLACKGGSNGGLLIGAVITQRPDLFRAAVCAVPLLDMLRYHKFLIARYWIPEYGDPDKKEDFVNILEYSPYHNIRTGFNYPTTMVKAGENDSRVDPLHAKKFAAALQNNPGQLEPILLYIDFDSGHGSGKSTDQMVETYLHEWTWLMNELGMK